jgi:lipase
MVGPCRLDAGGIGGTIEPIVFIHGIFQMMGDLPVAQLFATRPTLIPDMLGYGTQASVPAENISLEAQADHLATQIVRSCGNTKAHIVGHSVGGAVLMLLARRHPEIVASLINVEGNFTLEDAFWTGKIAAMHLSEVATLLQEYQSDTSGWVARAGIEPMPERVAIAGRGLHAQPATTVKAMAQSVIETTSRPSYLEDVQAVLDFGIPMHLLAGERSRAGWHVPESVLCRAASITLQPGVGHMMMLEAPEEFLGLVAKLVA